MSKSRKMISKYRSDVDRFSSLSTMSIVSWPLLVVMIESTKKSFWKIVFIRKSWKSLSFAISILILRFLYFFSKFLHCCTCKSSFWLTAEISLLGGRLFPDSWLSYFSPTNFGCFHHPGCRFEFKRIWTFYWCLLVTFYVMSDFHFAYWRIDLVSA